MENSYNITMNVRFVQREIDGANYFGGNHTGSNTAADLTPLTLIRWSGYNLCEDLAVHPGSLSPPCHWLIIKIAFRPPPTTPLTAVMVRTIEFPHVLQNYMYIGPHGSSAAWHHYLTTVVKCQIRTTKLTAKWNGRRPMAPTRAYPTRFTPIVMQLLSSLAKSTVNTCAGLAM
jgi:hypothetical protein